MLCSQISSVKEAWGYHQSIYRPHCMVIKLYKAYLVSYCDMIRDCREDSISVEELWICWGLTQTNMCSHIWRTRSVGQGVSATLQHFIIKLFYHTFDLYQKKKRKLLQFGLIMQPLCKCNVAVLVPTFLFWLCFCPEDAPGPGLPFLADFLSAQFHHRQGLVQSHLDTCWITIIKKIKNSHAHFLWYISTPWHIKAVHCDCEQTMDSSSHPFCPSCTTLSSGPSLFRIHLMPCCCGSMMSGQRSLVVRMAAFSVDILSFGRPWLCQAATVASSVSMRIGSRPSVRGTQTWNRNRGMMSL